MSNKSTTVKSCPFCGGTDISGEFYRYGGKGHVGGCVTWCATGPDHHTMDPARALEAWNQRAELQSPERTPGETALRHFTKAQLETAMDGINCMDGYSADLINELTEAVQAGILGDGIHCPSE